MRRSTRKIWVTVAGATGVALLATACGGGSSDDAAADGGEVTLTISTFNEFGYGDLLEEYQELHPEVTIEHNRFAKSDDAKEQFQTALGAGSGLADVVAVEVDWMPQILQYSDQFTDLTSDAVEGRWNSWTVDQATSADGRLLGYPTDIGPEAIAYRSDLFAAAGLPTDREEVAELFGGADATWDDFFAVGDQFMAAGTGPAFFDSADAIAQGMINQIEVPFEDPDSGEIIALDNPEVRDVYDTILSHSDQSGGFKQWEADWTNAFQNDGFAVALAPAWFLANIEGNAAGVEGWDIANVFPGGGGNWGGSFLSVPAMSEHPEEAQALAEWLTAPEQQLRAFAENGNFPSQIEAQESEELQTMTKEFFNDAPAGQIYTERAAAIEVQPYKGENYFTIRNGLSDAFNRVDVDKSMDAEQSWKGFEEAVAAIG
ncbi:ABC transporter substrate-binding protein [Streptomyces alfalfae]|uniref:ABC transporter substrate-binding protein n=1 Tax=Streptomyces alfalfae TaxID=1642299 RepID=UPI002810A4D5|nr:extracellular solute-binding protein [Streptomyces alfalfae]